MNILTFVGLSGFELFSIVFILFLPILFALVDVMRSNFQNKIDKFVWLILILALPLLGAAMYFVIRPKKVLS